MNSGDFARLVETIGSLSARQIEDLQHVLARLGLRMEALRQVESRHEAEPSCHRCECAQLVRWGRSRTGFQRWRCGACGTTRSTTTGTAVAAVRLPQAFHALIKEMFSGAPCSCRTTAERLGVNKMTVWRWRRLILGALLGVGATELQGIIEADETFQRESRKGSREWVRHRRDPASHPKPPRPRWRDFGKGGPKMERGLSKWQIPILTALDRSGRRRAQVIADLRAASIVGALARHIGRDAVLCSDAAPAYKKLAAARGLEHKILKNKRGERVVERVFHIQNINALHARYKEFITVFRGPATKYLPLYIAWFLASLADTRATAPDFVWDRLAA
jgi:transposase-like protein